MSRAKAWITISPRELARRYVAGEFGNIAVIDVAAQHRVDYQSLRSAINKAKEMAK